MSMQYLSSLYIWLHHTLNRTLIWDFEDALNYKSILSCFSKTSFMWRDCKVEIS